MVQHPPSERKQVSEETISASTYDKQILSFILPIGIPMAKSPQKQTYFIAKRYTNTTQLNTHGTKDRQIGSVVTFELLVVSSSFGGSVRD